MRQQVWNAKDLPGFRDATGKEIYTIASYMAAEYREKEKRLGLAGMILDVLGLLLLVLGYLFGDHPAFLLTAVCFLAFALLFAMEAYTYRGRERIFFNGNFRVLDGTIQETSIGPKGTMAEFASDLGDLLLSELPVSGNTVVRDQVLLVFTDAMEEDFMRIFTADMLTGGC